jgi:hypothetical protein
MRADQSNLIAVDPEPESDAEHARLFSSGMIEASLVGALVALVVWPITRIVSRARRSAKRQVEGRNMSWASPKRS